MPAPAKQQKVAENEPSAERLTEGTYRQAIAWLSVIVIASMLGYTLSYILGGLDAASATFFAAGVSGPVGVLGGILTTKSSR